MPANELAQLRDRLAAILREAGELALTAAKRPLKRWTKAGSSPVCEADIAVNDLLHARLPPLLPHAGWLSEETEDVSDRAKARQIWVVDPIDGTRAYLDRRPDWSISVALVEDGRPALAALYVPVSDEMFLAVRGSGATRNGVALRTTPGEAISGARFAGPKSFLTKLTHVAPDALPQPKVHSLALRLARVAEGELDAAFASRNSHDWDLAAADLLVHEAGGVMTDFSGNSLSYNRQETIHAALVAAGPARHATIIDLLRDWDGDFA